jgi:hypothetical protein
MNWQADLRKKISGTTARSKAFFLFEKPETNKIFH